MRSTTRRPASVLAALAVVAATLRRRLRLGRFAQPVDRRVAGRQRRIVSRGRARAPRTSRSRSSSAPCARASTQAAVDALFEQIKEFEAKYPWITVKPEEYNWTAPDVHRGPRRRHAAGRLHDPVHRRQGR